MAAVTKVLIDCISGAMINEAVSVNKYLPIIHMYILEFFLEYSQVTPSPFSLYPLNLFKYNLHE